MGSKKTERLPPLEALARKLEPQAEHIEYGPLKGEKKRNSKQQEGGSKHMPPLEALAKKLEPRADRVGPGAGADEQKRAHKQEEEKDTTKYSGLGAISNPAHKKARARVPESHSERVESLLDQYQEDMAEQDDEKEGDLSTGVKKLPRKKSFQESKLSHSDDSESGAWRPEGSKKTEAYGITGGQLGAKDPESRLGSDKVRSNDPLVGTQGLEAGNRNTP